jgi:hypothetical protein
MKPVRTAGSVMVTHPVRRASGTITSIALTEHATSYRPKPTTYPPPYTTSTLARSPHTSVVSAINKYRCARDVQR